jgi:hypothetical protein
VILGTHLNGLSTGRLPLYGITVSVAGLLAWSIPLRAFAGSPFTMPIHPRGVITCDNACAHAPR